MCSSDLKGKVVQMGYMYRYNPGIVFLREALAKGWLGEVFEVHAVMSKVVGAGSRKGLAEYPGGIMFELGCHIIDLVIGVLGAPQKVAAFSRHASLLDDGLVDNMLAVLEYPEALATVKSSAQAVEGLARRQLVVCGSEGTLPVPPLDSPHPLYFTASSDIRRNPLVPPIPLNGSSSTWPSMSGMSTGIDAAGWVPGLSCDPSEIGGAHV